MNNRDDVKTECVATVRLIYLRRIEELRMQRYLLYDIMDWMAMNRVEIPKRILDLKEKNLDERSDLMYDATSIVKMIKEWKPSE